MAGAESTLGPTCRSLSHTGIRFQTLALALSEALEYTGIRFGYSSLREALSLTGIYHLDTGIGSEKGSEWHSSLRETPRPALEDH